MGSDRIRCTLARSFAKIDTRQSHSDTQIGGIALGDAAKICHDVPNVQV